MYLKGMEKRFFDSRLYIIKMIANPEKRTFLHSIFLKDILNKTGNSKNTGQSKIPLNRVKL
ncbi:hypothetical protein CHH55_15645 [Niallia circulans]|nr:hypothetical protein CHH62_17435 [Niallia circulans]PAD86896.1 hypothetical protein CHH55_15645 [Niallia circulans]